MNIEIIVPLLLLIVAFLYASVGHGGASGYIAVLTLCGISLNAYKPVVLILNIIIASIAFIQFYRAGYFKWYMAWPFLLTSIPCAFLGSKFTTSEQLYKLLLGFALLFPIIRLLMKPAPVEREHKVLTLAPALITGAIIGFASGFLNIGGGIFLSPVIILMAWGNAKEAAAISSLFIVCNSLAGLAAVRNGINFTPGSYVWILAAATGGILGAYLGSFKYKLLTVRYVLAGVLFIASVKLISDFFS
jgi:uncharacterized membrane protein YfcA